MFGSDEKKALSDLYKVMMNGDAWKDLERFAEQERERSVKRFDDKSASQVTLCEVGEERGIRKGIYKILQHAQQRRDGI